MAQVKWRISKPPAGEKASIIAILYINDKIRPEIVTGEKVLPSNWNGSRVKNAPDRGEINLHLTNIERDLMQLWRDHKDKNKSTLIKLARQIVKGGSVEPQKKTFFEAFDKLLEIYKKEKDEKTLAKFKTLRAYLWGFDSEQYPVTFEGMTFTFYDDFKTFLYSQPNQTHPDSYFHKQGDYWVITKEKSPDPVGLFDDTVYKHIINLKIFLSWADSREYPIHPSFPKWKIIQREYEPISLTMGELECLEKQEIKQTHIDVGRDYLVLECRTAQRISDLKRFDVKDYENYVWSFTQYKGRGTRRKEETMRVYFTGYCKPALMILAKHKFQMPKISEQKLNKNLREACKLAGIDGEMYTERWVGNKCVRFYGKKYEFISTHTGRKTFITLGLQFMEPEMVMNLSGIKSYQTLKKYKAKSEPKVLMRALDKMEDDITVIRKAQ